MWSTADEVCKLISDVIDCLCFCHTWPQTHPNMKKIVAKKMIEKTIAMIRLSSLDILSDSVNIAYIQRKQLNTVDDILGSCSTH